MQPQRDSRSQGAVLEPTEARQASPRKMNFRVLLASMGLAVVVGVVLGSKFLEQDTHWHGLFLWRQAQRAGPYTSALTARGVRGRADPSDDIGARKPPRIPRS